MVAFRLSGLCLLFGLCVPTVPWVNAYVAAPRALPTGAWTGGANAGPRRAPAALPRNGPALLRPVRAGAFPRLERAVSQTARSALSTDVRDGVKDSKLDADGPQTKGRADGQSRSRRSEGDRLDDLAMQAAKSADMGLRYDPESAEVEFSGRILDVWRRDLQISVPLTAFLGQVLIDFQRGVEAENRPLRARQFMEIIAGLGPAFIKAGQALSSRPDLLPPEYLKELQKLQDRLPPFSNQKAFEIIEEQLGVPMSEVFERVEPEPVAAASIGQVYKGYLRTGEAVAIKVQRPEIEDVIGLDIYILRQLSGTLSQMIKVTLRRTITYTSPFHLRAYD
jgi:hypothetical protein